MRSLLISVISQFEWWILAYLLAINTIYFGLTLIGFLEMLRFRFLNDDQEGDAALEGSTLIPPVTVIAPAFNESATVCESVRAMLSLSYPEFEVIVVNDGSKDNTLQLLIEQFHLYRSARYYETGIETKPIRAVYESMDSIPLVVIDKENGGKADSLNAGINVSRYPLICCVDSDSLLEQDALMRVAKPLVQDPEHVIAVGGIVRVANGCTVANGRVLDVELPKSWVARFQVVEYLRAFLGGRVALSSFNSLLVISGAFGLFLKSAVLAVGGYRTSTVGEDMELVVRLHHWARRQKRKYKIVFEPNPVCWTEVPETLTVLKRQRNRWQRGTVETVISHRGMIGHPRYGILGMFAFPYFVAFEMLGPVVELSGYIITALGYWFGIFDVTIAVLFFVAAILYGVLLSTASILLEEMSVRRYPTIKSLLTLILFGLLENLGFRQLLTIWRAQAFLDIWNRKGGWGTMQRRGFQTKSC